MTDTETRRRFTNYGAEGQPSTHDPAFRVAFKRQRRAAGAAETLEAGEEGLDADELKRYRRRLADLGAAVNAGELYADADAETLASEEFDVVEIVTISGPRRVWADSIDEYADVLAGDDEEGSE